MLKEKTVEDINSDHYLVLKEKGGCINFFDTASFFTLINRVTLIVRLTI